MKIRGMDLTGQVYGSFTVLSFAGHKGPHKYWNCECSCGEKKPVKQDSLRNGLSTSCGCKLKETLKSRNQKLAKHLDCNSTEYKTWAAIRSRMKNKNHHAYSRYGGSDKELSERWEIYENFLEDMGRKPDPSYSIERLDNAKGYFRENCIWASSKTQNRNRSSNKKLTHKGQKKCMVEWAEQVGIHKDTLGQRLKAGWSVAEAIETPVGSRNRWTK